MYPSIRKLPGTMIRYPEKKGFPRAKKKATNPDNRIHNG
jgi:hypothetical protein